MRVLILTLLWLPLAAWSADADPKEVAANVIKQAGGDAKLLKLFRMKERLNVSDDPTKKGNERVSICEPPTYWWVGKTERVSEQKEPATFLVWAWTLGALTDPKSKLENVPDIKENDKPAYGLKVSGTITPALEMYFDKESHRLVRIDWRTDIHRFSDWKEADGYKYPSKCIGYKKATGKAWYFTEILEVERLKELPKGLSRKE